MGLTLYFLFFILVCPVTLFEIKMIVSNQDALGKLKGDRNFIKEVNEQKVLNLIRKEGPISRISISKKLDLSKTTVSEITYRLLREGYIKEVGKGNSSVKGGKKPTLVKLNPDFGIILAIEIKRSFSRVAVFNLEAEMIKDKYVYYDFNTSWKNVLAKIFNVIDSLIEEKPFKLAKKAAIAVGIPGLINYLEGSLKLADTLKGWDNLPVKRVFEERYGVPTYIENDVKAMTIGECVYGCGRGVKNLICLYIGDGIGSGIVVDGKLIRGISGSAGEVGYNEVGFFIRSKKNFPVLFNNQRDFGDIVSENSIVSMVKKAIDEGYRTELKKETVNIENIIKAADKNDELANEVFRELGILIGAVCINLINTINPEMIVLCGRLVDKNPVLVKLIKDIVGKDILRLPTEVVQICTSALKNDGVVYGLLGLVLNDWFEISINKILSN